jgi:putative MATE family efflux protein
VSAGHRADRLGTDPLGPLILRYALPVIVMLAVMALYNVVDRAFVGRGVGPAALAGVTVAAPYSMMISALGLLFGSGAAAAVSLSLGRRDRARAEASASAAVAASAAAGLLMAGAALVTLRPVLVLLGGSGEVLAQAERFTAVALVGGIFQIVGTTLTMALRSAGAPASSLVIGLVVTAVNLVLNPLFIFGLHVGVAGSALATTLAQLVGCLMALAQLRGHRGLLAIRWPRLADLPALRQVVALGAAPCCMLVALVPTIALSNKAVAAHGGPDGVAVMGIVHVVYTLVLLPLDGFTAGLQPVLGYNYGAGRMDRVRRALGWGMAAASGFCAAAWVPLLAFARPLVHLFVGDDSAAAAVGPGAVRTFFFVLPLLGVQVVAASYFQAVGKAGRSLFSYLLRNVILPVPLLVFLPRALGLEGVWLSCPISDVVAVAVTGGLVLLELRRLAAPRDAAPVPPRAEAA